LGIAKIEQATKIKSGFFIFLYEFYKLDLGVEQSMCQIQRVYIPLEKPHFTSLPCG
jgi:hypothetical protein